MNSQTTFPLDAVVAGYLGVDIAPGFPAGRPAIPAAELFRPGKLIETEGLSFSLGGVVANTGLAMKRFGQRVELMGCVGCDSLGDIVLAELKRPPGDPWHPQKPPRRNGVWHRRRAAGHGSDLF